MLRAEQVSYKIGNSFLLENFSLNFEAGIFHVIMGANGAGKTTLMRLLAGSLIPTSGEVYLSDKPVRTYSKKDLACRRAVLSQQYNVNFPIAAKEIAMMGRYPYFATVPSQRDREICNESLRKMRSVELSDREYNSLSGGEAQKIQMSRVLAQIWGAEAENKKILFLDEPVSHLDLKYQRELLNTARELCDKNIMIIAILHDINLALQYADRMVFLKSGRLVHSIGDPGEINSDLIKEVFDVDASVMEVGGGRRLVVF